MEAILSQLAVEKYRFSRILCGFFHLGTSKGHKYQAFLRVACSQVLCGPHLAGLGKTSRPH
jgi:hypothetical protein